MAEQPTDLDPYLAEHVHEALAQDPRVAELGVEVAIRGQTVVLSGTVTSAERQSAAAALVQELLPEHDVRNETQVADLPEPAQSEHLP